MITRKQFALATFAILAATITGWMPEQVAASGRETFVAYSVSAVRIDGDPPKEWNLYHETGRKTNEVVLLEWGERFLRIDAHLKEVRELKADSITRKKESISWTGDNSATTVLPSSDWVFRDVGSAQRLHLMLTTESHEIEIDLPKYAK